ncbi:MAG: ABC transporter permease, partial [Lachnospiraceae bacterium]|nr:ABC transporter permease [Lachnospiraceae bacterium]
MDLEEQRFQTVIKPKNNLFDLKLKEVFHYRDLISLFVKRDFVSRYKQTILGPAWAVIQPLLTTVVFTIIFGSLANLTTFDEPNKDVVIPGFLFYMAGTICWSYFSSVVNGTSATFINNAAIMGKVYFPRLVTPISIACSNLIQFGIQLVMFIVIYIFYLLSGTTTMHLSWFILLIPLIIVQMMMLSMGFGIIISALTTK